MVSLILPPIILVISIAALIYFFSRRLSTLEARAHERADLLDEKGSSWVAFQDNIKHLFWRFLERITRRSKLSFLKAHNIFNSLSDTVRKQKEASRERLMKFREKRSGKGQHAATTERATPEESVAGVVTKESGGGGMAVEMPDRFRPARDILDRFAAGGSAVSESPAVEAEIHLRDESKIAETPVSGDDSESFIRRRSIGRRRKSKEEQEEQISGSDSNKAVISREDMSAEKEPQKKDQFEEILIERIVSNPRDVEAYERLGDYYLENDNYVDAKECYRQVLKLSPVNRLVKIKIRRLEKILGRQR